jgi:hypothetical protein
MSEQGRRARQEPHTADWYVGYFHGRLTQSGGDHAKEPGENYRYKYQEMIDLGQNHNAITAMVVNDLQQERSKR